MTKLRFENGRCLKREGREGQGLTEYGIVISLLSVTVFAVFPSLQPLWKDQFSNFGGEGGIGRSAVAGALGVDLAAGAESADGDESGSGGSEASGGSESGGSF